MESDPDVAGPKVPDAVKKEKEEPIKKKKRITLTEDEKETSFLLITNLTRPFTVNSFKEMLKRTGTIDDFWIDRWRSWFQSMFQTPWLTTIFSSESSPPAACSSATMTRRVRPRWLWMGWPGLWVILKPWGCLSQQRTRWRNTKRYVVWQPFNYFSYLWDYLITNVFQTADGVLKPSGDHGDRMAGVREWDRDKGKVEERDRDREDRRQDRDRREVTQSHYYHLQVVTIM